MEVLSVEQSGERYTLETLQEMSFFPGCPRDGL